MRQADLNTQRCQTCGATGIEGYDWLNHAKSVLGEAINADNSIGPSYGHYMAWSPGDEKITLDCEFTTEELEVLAWWMKNKSKPQSPTNHGV